MPLIIIAETIRTAPTGSEEFKVAIAAIKEMVGRERTTEEPNAAVEGHYAAIRDRFRNGEELAALATVVGACGVVAIFSTEVNLDIKNLTDGAGAKVNVFAALHLRSCERCRLFFEVETLRRSLTEQCRACAVQEN